jgi:hypothetical protein
VSDTELWSMAVGFLSATFVLPVLQQPRWSDRTRAFVTFVWCLLAAAGTAYLTGAFDGARDVRAFITAFLSVFVAAIVTYRGLAKPSGLAPALEAATSPPDPETPWGRHHRRE